MLLLVLGLCARTASGLILGSLLLAWRRRRHAWSEPWFPLLLAVAIAWLLIDVRVGPKFPRHLCTPVPSRDPCRERSLLRFREAETGPRPILAAVLAVALLENVLGLGDLKRAALGVREVFDGHAAAGQTVYVEANDTFDRIFRAAYFEDEVPAFATASVCDALAGSVAQADIVQYPQNKAKLDALGTAIRAVEVCWIHRTGFSMRKVEDSKFYEMFQEIDRFIAELRAKHGGGQDSIADSLMALCLMVAKVLSHENLPASVAEGYIASFTRFIDSVSGKGGENPLDKLGKGSN